MLSLEAVDDERSASMEPEDVVHGVLRHWRARMVTLHLANPIAPERKASDPILADIPLEGGFWIDEIPLLLSPGEGAWVLGWGDDSRVLALTRRYRHPVQDDRMTRVLRASHQARSSNATSVA